MLRRPLRSLTRPPSTYVCLSCLTSGVIPPLTGRRPYSYAAGIETPSSAGVDPVLHSIPPTAKDGLAKRGKKAGSKRRNRKKLKIPLGAKTISPDKKSQTVVKKAQELQGTVKESTKVKKVSKKVLAKAASKEVTKLLVRKISHAPSPAGTEAAQRAAAFAQAKQQTLLSKSQQSNGNEAQEEQEQKREPKVRERSISETQSATVAASDVGVQAVNVESSSVPGLSYGLDRVLFNPGVYHLQDPRTRVYNFDPYLGSIMPISEFDFEALAEYITSSKDSTLRKVAAENGKKYIGSSSSMTGVLSHFHFLLSGWRPINTDMISQGFPEKLRTFTRLSRSPSAVFLRYKDGVYAIDADKEFDSASVLMNLGKSMEKLLTVPTEEYERYRRKNAERLSPDDAPEETYHYSTCGDFLMRSQLDAHDPRLPGTGMFDLKTRAVVSIRMQSQNVENGLGYQIKGRFGCFESYEREYFDMIRSAFLKYSLQVRIGRMDGIFVAFHNVERIFGFQYVSLPEMDLALHGQENTALGDAEFKLSLDLWNKVLDKATSKFPNQSIRFHFETRNNKEALMYIFAEPMTEDEIDDIQTRNKAETEAIQKKLLYPELYTEPEEEATSEEETSRDNYITESDTLESQEASSTEADTSETATEEDASSTSSTEPPTPRRPLLAMNLTIRNIVNGEQVDYPKEFTSKDSWKLEYAINTYNEERGWKLYEQCQTRRQRTFSGTDSGFGGERYIDQLNKISKAGRRWRANQDKLEKEHGTIIYKE